MDHPDIEAFITAKNNSDKLTGFNVSVGVTDEFMEHLKREASVPTSLRRQSLQGGRPCRPLGHDHAVDMGLG